MKYIKTLITNCNYQKSQYINKSILDKKIELIIEIKISLLTI